MSYSFNSVTIRTDNSEGGIAKINELWADIMQGKIPLDFLQNGTPVEGLFPISVYSNYENNEKGKYDLSIMTVNNDFFVKMEELVKNGNYCKVDESGSTISDCVSKAWLKVWEMSKRKEMDRAFTVDYESSVPVQYSKDGKAHCYLYVAVK